MKVNWRRIAGALLVLAAAGAVAQSARTTADQRRFVECQARVNEALVERSRALTEVTDSERVADRVAFDALNATLNDPSLLKPADQRTPADQQRVRELYLEFRTAAERLKVERARADQARREHPVPPPPSELCG